MGDPKKKRKKYEGPKHPWNKERIEREIVLKRNYGLKNKTELWKMESILRRFTFMAKKLIAATGKQAEKEESQMMQRLQKLGLLQAGALVDDVLGLKVESILDRRLQTLVFKKGLAKTIGQARQFIVHRHVVVGDKKISTPSYLVPVNEESGIRFAVKSPLFSEAHPERAVKNEKQQ